MAEVHSRCTECGRTLIRIYDPVQVKEWEEKVEQATQELNGWNVVGRDLVQIHRQSSKMAEIWTDNQNLFASSKRNGFHGLCPYDMEEYLKRKGLRK